MMDPSASPIEIHVPENGRRRINFSHPLFQKGIVGNLSKNTVNSKNSSVSKEPNGKSLEHHSDRNSLKTTERDCKLVVSSEKVSQNSRVSNYSSCKKYSSDLRKHHDNESEVISRLKSKSFNGKDNTKKKPVHTNGKISDVSSHDEEYENYIEFNGVTCSRKVLNLDDKNYKICIENNFYESTLDTYSSNKSQESNMYDLQNNLSCIDFNKEQPLLGGENYIPPPVICSKACNTQISSGTSSEKNEEWTSLNDGLESSETASDPEDEIYFPNPDSEQIETVTKFILAIVEEKSVSKSLADEVERDLNIVFREQLDGHRIEVYGSYFSDLAISTSDINLALISDCSIRRSFMHEVYKLLCGELKLYSVFPYEDGNSPHDIKISFSHINTGIKCQLAYLGKSKSNVSDMGRFLRRVSKIDDRVKTLIIAAKIWSECVNINEVDDGKLHPVGYALMVLHFLQHCECPILSTFPCEKENIELLTPNNSSIGELWLAFLKYYSITFNWKEDVITLDSKECVSKKSKGWECYWIAIEDPFTGKNIGRSVINSDVAEYIKACFKSSYEYFCNPSSQMLNTDDDGNESNEDSLNSKYLFSFQQCIAEQIDAFCEDCENSMETCEECQKKLYVQPMLSVPKMTDSFLKILKDSLMTVYERYMLSEDEINQRRLFVEELQAHVHNIYPDAELNLFGSSTNGFGFKSSDLDICISFKSKRAIHNASVLKDLRSLLRKDRDFDCVIAIFSASIPILKFHYKPKNWRGDISLHNTLAIHNSSLLYTYSLLDERCKILGCAFKLLAKKALIAEVTEKALSSYSYLNMVIYFLQQIEPPVLPILQDKKFCKNGCKKDYIVENCDVWFCDDQDYIKSVFKTENKTPVEQLWLELLDYYCSYDYNKFISIRQKDPEYNSEEKRSARLFNIQDPFIITKNLGCVVSAKKAQETKSVLSRARQLFRTPVKELPTCVKDVEDFFFSTQSLTGRIHKEAQCDLCGKFGHEKDNCKQSFPFKRFHRRIPFHRTFSRQNFDSRYQINRYPKQGPRKRPAGKQLPARHFNYST